MDIQRYFNHSYFYIHSFERIYLYLQSYYVEKDSLQFISLDHSLLCTSHLKETFSFIPHILFADLQNYFIYVIKKAYYGFLFLKYIYEYIEATPMALYIEKLPFFLKWFF